jgi:hypothetical protein
MTDEEKVDQIEESIQIDGSIFPNEMVSPGIKGKPEYGAAYAKAMYKSSNRFGIHGNYWNNGQFDELMELAQGRQSVETLRKMFGFYGPNSSQNDATDDGSSNLAWIDVQVLNLAPKYINRAVAKMCGQQYETQIQAVDPISVHTRANYEASIKAYYEYKKWITDMGFEPQQFFEDLDVSVLPEYPEELMMDMVMNPKLREAAEAEDAITLIHQNNNFNQVMRDYAWDVVVFGPGHIHCYRDESGRPTYKRINPKYYIGSYVENEDFKDQEYAGYLDFPTVNQFRKEASGTLSESEIKDIISKHAIQSGINSTYSGDVTDRQYDGLSFIPVMRFYFLTEDMRQFLIRKKNKKDKVFPRGLEWKPNEEDERAIFAKEAEVVMTNYTSVYGGTWVIDTDSVYGYGLKTQKRTNLVDRTLPIKTFIPNYRDGRTVSFLAQMKEPLMMINVAWNKIKEILAKGWMGVQELDFTQMEAIAMGKGGKVWTPRQVYMHFLKTGRLIKRSNINKHGQNPGGSAVESNSSGLELADYFTAFTTGIQMLEAMTATDVAASAQQPDRLTGKVAQMSQLVADLDMQYLFNAYERMYNAVTDETLLLMQEAKMDGIGIQGYVPALGKNVVVPDTIAYCDLGLFITRAPGPEEWLMFYQEIQLGLENGQIDHMDSAFIREVKNLKKARYVFALRSKINERKVAQQTQMNHQMQMEANAASAQQKMQSDAALLQMKAGFEKEMKSLQGQIDQLLQAQELEAKSNIQYGMDRTKKEVEKTRGVFEVVKQAGKNNSEERKQFRKSQSDEHRDAEKNMTELEKAEKQAKKTVKK